ncbi:MAG: extracellular catalytic domain type 1 short-chain-length polyhydroxyalkanoate depolymerase [Vulcanimicrobiaceae bacterium]
MIGYRLYAPNAVREGSARVPLLVALHGCTQTAPDFAAGTRFDRLAERDGFVALYPEQSPLGNPQLCWNWFLPEHQARASGEPAEILALVERIAGELPIDRSRIFVAGLSAGGAMAAILAELAPEIFAAAGIVAGIPLYAARDLAGAYAAMQGSTPRPAAVRPRRRLAHERLRATIWTGDDDRVVDPRNAELLVEQFRALSGSEHGAPSRELVAGSEVARWRDRAGRVRVERWTVAGMGHAWSGGSFRGSHTFPPGPRASEAMVAFFLDRPAQSLAPGDEAAASNGEP